MHLMKKLQKKRGVKKIRWEWEVATNNKDNYCFFYQPLSNPLMESVRSMMYFKDLSKNWILFFVKCYSACTLWIYTFNLENHPLNDTRCLMLYVLCYNSFGSLILIYILSFGFLNIMFIIACSSSYTFHHNTKNNNLVHQL